VLPALIDLRNSRTVCLIKRLAFNRKYGMPKKDAGLHFCKLKALQKSPKKIACEHVNLQVEAAQWLLISVQGSGCNDTH
jgi:hypothetical protein